MTTTTMHPFALDYLKRLKREANSLPRARRHELVGEIEAYLQESIEPDASDAEAMTVLDRLGEPAEILEAERPQPVPAARRRGTQEWAAIFLLLFGGFLFFVGWIAGLVLLWSSTAWTRREKLVGTLVVPGGFALLPVLLVLSVSGGTCTSSSAGQQVCSGGSSELPQVLTGALLLCALVGPILTAVFLSLRANARWSSNYPA
jgi:hypothetical protein